MVIYRVQNLDCKLLDKKILKYFQRRLDDPSDNYIVYLSHRTYEHLLKTFPTSLDKAFVQKLEILPDEMKSIEDRIVSKLEALLSDAPPENLLEEIKLLLWVNPTLMYQYLGRALESTPELLKDPDLFDLDIAGGKRRYYWRTFRDISKLKETSPFVRFHALKEWFTQPDTRIVLCIGQGGVRMYCATAVLKIFDLLDVRNNISEIWGCSGGSLIGYPYSMGVAPQWIEQVGYDFYSDRYPDFKLRGMRLDTLLGLGRHLSKIFKNFRPGIIEFRDTFASALAKGLDKRDKSKPEIPFFAISTSSNQKKYLALTDKKNIEPYHENFLCECHSVKAMFASAAIPFLFKPELIQMPAGGMEFWVDGALNEETPLAAPYIKWQLDRKHRPQTTESKLKIFYIDLGTRASELALLNQVQSRPWLQEKLKSLAKMVDRVLDYKSDQLVTILNSIENVEVKGIRVQIGLFGALDTRMIPLIIQRSRIYFIEQLEKLFSD